MSAIVVILLVIFVLVALIVAVLAYLKANDTTTTTSTDTALKAKLLVAATALDTVAFSTNFITPVAEGKAANFLQLLTTCGVLMQNFSELQRFGARLVEIGTLLDISLVGAGAGAGVDGTEAWNFLPSSGFITDLLENGPAVSIAATETSLIQSYNLVISSLGKLTTFVGGLGTDNIILSTAAQTAISTTATIAPVGVRPAAAIAKQPIRALSAPAARTTVLPSAAVPKKPSNFTPLQLFGKKSTVQTTQVTTQAQTTQATTQAQTTQVLAAAAE